jgi:NAD(P)-dependent dehydrogenase (short-subunit alcohol dehydrogenase family)
LQLKERLWQEVSHDLTKSFHLQLKKSGPGARIVFVNSGAADNAPPQIEWSDLTGSKAKDSGMHQYNLSKLYNFMTAKALAKEVQVGTGCSKGPNPLL